MCGITSVITRKNIHRKLFFGLKALKYRGYDSAGIAVMCDLSTDSHNSTALFNNDTEENEKCLLGSSNKEYENSAKSEFIFRSCANCYMEIYKVVGMIEDLEFLYQKIRETKSNLNQNKDFIKCGVAQEMQYKAEIPSNFAGIAHTRWSTHGEVNLKNTHPISFGDVTIVHNGVITNHDILRSALEEQGNVLIGESDTEVIAATINKYIVLGLDIIAAIRAGVAELQGNFAFVAIFHHKCDCLYGFAQGAPLVFAINEDKEPFIVSDTTALYKGKYNIVYLEEGDGVIVKGSGKDLEYEIYNQNRSSIVNKNPRLEDFISEIVEDYGSKNHMYVEILEQSSVLSRLMEKFHINRLNNQRFTNIIWENFPKGIKIIGCGSSYNVGVFAKYWIEGNVEVPVDVEIASEFCTRNVIIDSEILYLFISQSGETADTIIALKKVKSAGCCAVALVNKKSNQMGRIADQVILLDAGAELAVASTKTFTAQILAILFLSIEIMDIKTVKKANNYGSIDNIEGTKEIKEIIREFSSVHTGNYDIRSCVDVVYSLESQIEALAKFIARSDRILFVARGMLYPIALEGALKMKELSYISSEGIASGELKHGPLALVDSNTAIIVICDYNDSNFEKVMTNLYEIRARNGNIFVFCTNKDSESFANSAKYVFNDLYTMFIDLGKCKSYCVPVLHSVALQILAYYVAMEIGNNVDYPRNLAKAVTVE